MGITWPLSDSLDTAAYVFRETLIFAEFKKFIIFSNQTKGDNWEHFRGCLNIFPQYQTKFPVEQFPWLCMLHRQ